MTTAMPQNTAHARSFRVSTRFHSSVTAGSTGAVERWRASASRTTSVMATIAAPRTVLRDRAAQHRRVGKRAQDVGDREPRWVLELHAVHDERRVEHAQPDAEHADAQEVGDELPGRRLGEPEPDHRLD